MEHLDNIEIIKDIKGMMERSSRFVSLSGLSGVAAGICALIGAGFAYFAIDQYYVYDYAESLVTPSDLFNKLFLIAVFVFIAALASALFFTWRKCKKDNTVFGGYTSRKLFFNTLLPMVVGGVVIIKLIQINAYHLVAPTSLIFYGLALLTGSNYTLGEIKWVGIINIILGLAGLWLPHYHLLLWALGFGVAHIVYGWWMWRKYEQNNEGVS